MTNASCVQGTAAFNQREISTSVYEFAHFDAQDARLHTVLVKYAPYQMQVVYTRHSKFQTLRPFIRTQFWQYQ